LLPIFSIRNKNSLIFYYLTLINYGLIPGKKREKQMSSFLQKECDLKYFHNNNYVRKKCKSCGSYYWTLDKKSELCGDRPCVEFSFIGKPLGKKPLSLKDVRNSFLNFFEKNKHSRLNYPETGERCPVVARWRTDIYLTIASIADFQPHVTSGEVPPPANPLVISQPCIRLNDLEQVGVSGRHLTMFEMMGHHAFNKNKDEIYFKEETVRLCNEYFTEHIGIPKEKINYKEELWFGGGNAGPCLEVLAGGLEIATLVFMNMKEDEHGDFEIEGEKYSPNPLNIVDTGYGLERIAWITNGTKTVYETVFPEIIDYLEKNSQKKDWESIYSLADHSKCLAFMIGDGIVPSNVKAGYLARLIIRRALRFIKKIKFNKDLKKLVLMQLNLLKNDFSSIMKNEKQIAEILDIETKRYNETISKGEKLVKRILKDKKTIDEKELINLYDTHGMQPDIVKRIAKSEGASIDIPDNFESMIAELHTHANGKEGEMTDGQYNLSSTEKLYYKDHYKKEFDAKVLSSKSTKDGYEIVLDKTAFYPEGGGQPGDIGYLQNNGNKIAVKFVRKSGDAIIHQTDNKLSKGDKIHGTIDWNNRYQLMKHHTGTHLVNAALRKTLGNHIWQAGSQLSLKEARFDFSHYKTVTENEQKEIEKIANEFIKKSISINKIVLDRNSAEKKYGFRLYQGGVPPGNSIRVLDIPSVDVEACGGTHLNNTNEVEKIRIIKIERIQDGVNRAIFAAGKMVDLYQKEEKQIYENVLKILAPFYDIKKKKNIPDQLKKITDLFSVPSNQIEKTLERFINETKPVYKQKVDDLSSACKHLFKIWKKTQKEKKKVSQDDIKNLIEKAITIPKTDIKIVATITEFDSVSAAGEITKNKGFVAHIYDGEKLVSMASSDVDIDLRKIAPEIGKILGGSGGGKPKMTQCGGPNKEKIKEALEKAEFLTKKLLT